MLIESFGRASTDPPPQYRGRLVYQGVQGQCWNQFGQAVETQPRALYFLGRHYADAMAAGRIRWTGRENERQVFEVLAAYTPAAYTLTSGAGLRHPSHQGGRVPFPAAIIAQGRLTQVYATPDCPCPLLGAEQFLSRNEAIRRPTQEELASRARECGSVPVVIQASPVNINLPLPAAAPPPAATEGGFPWWLLVLGGVTVYAVTRE